MGTNTADFLLNILSFLANCVPQIIRNYHGQIETLKETQAVKIAEIKRSVSIAKSFTNIIHAVKV